jgi:excisionase family DNA binding protein
MPELTGNTATTGHTEPPSCNLPDSVHESSAAGAGTTHARHRTAAILRAGSGVPFRGASEVNDALEAPLPRTMPQRPATVAEGAAYRRVSTRTIWRYIAKGDLRAYRFGSKLVRIDLDDLDRLTRRVPTAGGSDAA